MQSPIRRLYRSRSESMLAGICAGLGFYFRVDPVIVRLLWLLVTCMTGFLPGIVAYLVTWIVVPAEPAPAPAARPVRPAEDSPA